MTGIDNMLSGYIKKTMEVQLGQKMTSKIEEGLELWYHMSLDEAVMEFEKLDRVLAHIYGKSSAKSLEKRFLKSIVGRPNFKNNDSHLKMAITEPQLVQTILSIVGDESFQKMFRMMEKGNFSFEQILEKSGLNLAKPSAYRKMELLAKTGLISDVGYVMGSGNRNVKAYKRTFDSIDIRFNRGEVNMMMTVSREAFDDSMILSTVFA